MNLSRILNSTNLQEESIKAIFPYGSRVYGTANYQSDYDFIVINNSDIDDREIRNGDLNIHLHTVESFQNHINNHKIFAIECISLSKENTLKLDHSFSFTLDRIKLRHEIASKASNSWVKAKKKLLLDEEDDYIGKKSMFHSLRILDFGIQIATHGKIVDFSSSNHLWNEIKSIRTWDELNTRYKKLFNKLNSDFRILAPKE